MKWLHVLGDDGLGGCERLSLDLAGYYARRGFAQEVVFFGQAGHGPAWRAFESLGLAPVWLPYCGRPVGFVCALAGWVRRRQVSAVLTHGLGMHLLVALAGRLGGARAVWVLVGNPPPQEPVLLAKMRRRTRLARPLTSGEIACSHYVQRAMLRDYGLPDRRIRVLHNWVDAEGIAGRAERRRAQCRDTRTSAKAPVLLMVARLDPIKDHRTVLQAIALIKGRFSGLRLRLVGDGPMREALQMLAAECGIGDVVEFLGAREDVPEQLGEADLFIFGTTRDEGFGIVLIEAMAAGVPIVCTRAGPCAEVLDEGRGGMLVPPQDPKALAEAIAAMLDNPDMAHRYAEAGRALVHSRYSVASAGETLLGWVS